MFLSRMGNAVRQVARVGDALIRDVAKPALANNGVPRGIRPAVAGSSLPAYAVNRMKLSDDYALLKTQSRIYQEHTNLPPDVFLINLVPRGTSLHRRDHDAYGTLTKKNEPKSSVDHEGRVIAPGGLPLADVHTYDAMSKELAHAVREHVRGSKPSAFTSFGSAEAHKDVGEFIGTWGGSTVELDPARAPRILPTKLIVSLLLFEDFSDEAVAKKPWNWMTDPALKINASDPDSIAEARSKLEGFGINPDQKDWSRNEKLAAFAVLAGEYLVMWSTHSGAAVVHE